MSWLSTIADWFSGRPGRPVSRSFDHATFVELCAENPQEARAMLAADQYALAKEIERTFASYDARLKDLASRVHELKPEEFKREAKTIRDAQDGLRRALRRLDVSAKTAKELQHELLLWERRNDETPLHADHPSFRSEIIRSELRSRGALQEKRKEAPVVEEQMAKPILSPQQANAMLWLTHDEGMNRSDEVEVTDEFEEMEDAPVEPLTLPEVQYLLQAIREATREAERWHAVPADSCDEDALVQVHHVRDLHALLKRLDRENGVYRDRLELAVSPRELR
jgi:hypothetical protein